MRQPEGSVPPPPGPLAPPAIPLLIGIVGKRDLGGHDHSVSEAIHAQLASIRRHHPNSPIWVLTSAAAGADWAAVEATARLARSEQADPYRAAIRLIVPMPLARELFAQDFVPDHAARFDLLLDQRSVKLKTETVTFLPENLTAFALEPLRGTDPELMSRVPAGNGKSGAHRTLHYEQAALFISDNVRLLIAVAPEGGDAGAIGGTARSIHYRCTGRLADGPSDPAFAALALELESRVEPALPVRPAFPADDMDQSRLRRLSGELRDLNIPTEWLSPRRGAVAQLHPGPSSTWHYRRGSTDGGIEPATHSDVFSPLALYEEFNAKSKARYAGALADLAKANALPQTVSSRVGKIARAEQTIASYNDPTDAVDVRTTWAAATADKTPSLTPAHLGAITDMFRLRRMISDLQQDAKLAADRSIWALGLLFIPTVGLFAVYKAAHLYAAGVGYLVLIVIGAAAYGLVRQRGWSQYHDDFRAWTEALRVQVWWRVAGIGERVEHQYQPGARQELDQVRDGISTINSANALAFRDAVWPAAGQLVDYAAAKWIDGQARWFAGHRKERARHGAVALMSVALAFGGGTGAFLCALLHSAADTGGLPPLVGTIGRVLGVIGILAFLVRFREALLPERVTDSLPAGFARDWANSATLTQVFPIFWCLGPIFFGYWIAGLALPYLPTWHISGGSEVDPVETIGITVAVLNGLTGAIVYWREKFAFEPEERNYAELEQVFATGSALLRATPADATDIKQRIMIELGRAALTENAAWLRAHRERPIEQIAGG